MAKKKKSKRGVEVKDISNFQYGYRADSSNAVRTPVATRRVPVDPAVLKRAYILHNFQFVLRHDAQQLRAVPGLPQRPHQVTEALRLSGTTPPWDLIIAVVARGTWEEFHCPVCLEEPQAARITSCGHVFCLVCVLQYISRRKAESKQRTCPVCSNFITVASLRPCMVRLVEPPSVGARASFTMLKRKGDSCILLRQDDPCWKETTLTDDELRLPFYGEPSATYSRYVISTESGEATLREDECTAITRQISMLEAQPRPFTSFDDDLLKRAEDALRLTLQGVPQQQSAGETRSSPPLAPKTPGTETNMAYEFYGETDGQAYYMHPITYKMLCVDAEARNSPLRNVVEAPVEEITTFTQDEASRKRYRVFAHVPLHATIKLCLLDLSDIVLASTMKIFEPTLARLRKSRQLRESSISSSTEDSTWQEYLRRYRTDWRGEAERTLEDMSPMSEFMMSEMSADFERLPALELSPSDGTPPLGPVPQASAGRETPGGGCWKTGNSLQLFSSPPVRPVVPTWGGHGFNPNKPSSNVSLAEGRKR
ncbi:Zinc finger, C3HC4 type (RING finger), putative [Trypanosoma equiperdum]|uniref:RING-type domain-containing protein n=2 Tax=Trypanozoon TaxID=39700 RepID=Q57Z86_TRYB2|nr:hypothetical protein, conserved [Trypanosoma brucei brucei TREU927]AAX79547.1 hypothetical protein, conserved [Trypanosoma brucei]AAZ11420.1 hypothetical protein, conserved [Trypanosoma brucei brucei TREU927]SCU65092.1 Zinc finger, C3HC4 type (RING finger), putative [Trypanosoma equiperdum]